LPLVCAGVAAAIAIRLDRSATALAAAAMALAYVGLWRFGLTQSEASARLAYATIGLALPLCVASLQLLQPRDLLSVRGLMQVAMLAVPAALAVYIIEFQPQPWAHLLGNDRWVPGLDLPRWTAAALSVGLSVSLIQGLSREDPGRGITDAAFLGALLSMVLALRDGRDAQTGPAALAVYFSVGQVVLITALIESLHALTYQDTLTGLRNRRALNEHMNKLSGGYVVAMLDVDHFKQFNDKHGHDVGDEVLKMVATKIGQVGGGGQAYRYGGEEFTVLFPGRTAADAIGPLERVRQTIESAELVLKPPAPKKPKPKAGQKSTKKSPTKKVTKKPPKSKKVRVTISIGLAERTPHLKEPEAVIEAADKALYQAKEQGRNQVVAAGTPRKKPSQPS
jgi:GGDEF domain-containing protein